MRLKLLLATVCAVLFTQAAKSAEPEMTTVELRSGLVNPGLPLAENEKGVYGFRLTAQVDKKGEGSGSLELDPTAPTFDEFGYLTNDFGHDPVKLECRLKFVKKGTVRVATSRRIAAPEENVEWLLFEILGPKITSRLVLAIPAIPDGPGGSQRWSSGRLLVRDKAGKVRYVVDVRDPGPPEPCHPGCFPAGTAICVPGGTRPVEQVHEGDLVTTIGPDGTMSQGKVEKVFVTRNRLLQVHTDAGDLLTTETQPLAQSSGGLQAAGQLKAGDQIFRWNDGKRRVATVESISLTGRFEPVYNLILGDPAIFVANGFLARSKPPAPATAVLESDVFEGG